MKRILLVVIAAGIMVFARAQVQFAVKAGVNIADLNLSGGPSGFTFSTKTDFSGGIFVSVPLFSNCFLQPEVVYSGQGASFKDSLATVKDNYNYINVPVLFKYLHSSGLFAETGPQIGFLLSANEKVNGQTFDMKSNTQSTDFSWVFGIGYKLPLGLGIDLRYNLGLVNLAKGSYTDGTIKNSVFQFGLFYMFPKL
jgi:Outer membrane protein beta-barrel domain